MTETLRAHGMAHARHQTILQPCLSAVTVHIAQPHWTCQLVVEWQRDGYTVLEVQLLAHHGGLKVAVNRDMVQL